LPDKDLLSQLKGAVQELETKMIAVLPINKGGNPVGYGVNKTQRNIAAEAVISIAKAIKGGPGW